MEKKAVKIRFALWAGLTAVLILIGLFAPWITPFDPNAQNLGMALEPPSAINILGTDQYGRDMFSRVIAGSRTTLFSALLLVGGISLFGTFVGIFSAYKGGRTDSFLMRITDVFLAFPALVFAIAVAAFLGGGMKNAVIALALISWPKYARLTRGLTVGLKNEPFIHAARMGGCSTVKIVVKHILPNILDTVVITAALDIGTMILEIAGLSFLGLGAMPPTAEWGAMMSNGRSMIQSTPWVILAPGAAIFISVSIFNLLGDALRDLLAS